MSFESFRDFEKIVGILLTKAGWAVDMPPANQRAYLKDETKKSQVLKDEYKHYFNDLSLDDQRFQFIDSEEASIRTSKQLFYWGYHLYTHGKPELAFNSVGGRCYPKADFLNLLQYLEENSKIANLK